MTVSTRNWSIATEHATTFAGKLEFKKKEEEEKKESKWLFDKKNKISYFSYQCDVITVFLSSCFLKYTNKVLSGPRLISTQQFVCNFDMVTS